MVQIYIVYPGLGKTTLAKQNTRFADLESRVFKDAAYASCIGAVEYPCTRGTQIKELNPDWPQNYISFAREKLAAGKTLLLVPKQDNYDLIEALNVKDYIWVLPDESRIEQLRKDQIARGDNLEYIDKNLGERYTSVLELAKQTRHSIVFVEVGSYLKDMF